MPNCIALGADAFSVEAFTHRVMLYGSLLELHINCGLRFIWSTEVRREMRMAVLNISLAYLSARTIMNPHWVRSSTPPPEEGRRLQR